MGHKPRKKQEPSERDDLDFDEQMLANARYGDFPAIFVEPPMSGLRKDEVAFVVHLHVWLAGAFGWEIRERLKEAEAEFPLLHEDRVDLHLLLGIGLAGRAFSDKRDLPRAAEHFERAQALGASAESIDHYRGKLVEVEDKRAIAAFDACFGADDDDGE